jgi:hypothetical protein
MRKLWIFYLVLWGALPPWTWAQEDAVVQPWEIKASLDPVVAGIRYDDNVYRSVMALGKDQDGIGMASFGGLLSGKHDLFKGNLGYHFSNDQYFINTVLNNYTNDFDLFLAATPGDLSLYFKKEYFIRNSHFSIFNYFDDQSWAGLRVDGPDSWDFDLQYKNSARQYYDLTPAIWSRNFVDQSGSFTVQREMDERLSMKFKGSYNNRQFNRYAVDYQGGILVSQPWLQSEDTWTFLLNAHLYFASILQDINLEGQRTDSNSYGFSNSVQSVSWVGVIRPAPSLYFQLFFRFYFKTYDKDPLTLPDLQLGFIDEESQDILSAKANWEFAPSWMGSLNLSRIRSESDQPGAYYIKNLISLQIRRSF